MSGGGTTCCGSSAGLSRSLCVNRKFGLFVLLLLGFCFLFSFFGSFNRCLNIGVSYEWLPRKLDLSRAVHRYYVQGVSCWRWVGHSWKLNARNLESLCCVLWDSSTISRHLKEHARNRETVLQRHLVAGTGIDRDHTGQTGWNTLFPVSSEPECLLNTTQIIRWKTKNKGVIFIIMSIKL